MKACWIGAERAAREFFKGDEMAMRVSFAHYDGQVPYRVAVFGASIRDPVLDIHSSPIGPHAYTLSLRRIHDGSVTYFVTSIGPASSSRMAPDALDLIGAIHTLDYIRSLAGDRTERAYFANGDRSILLGPLMATVAKIKLEQK